MSKDPAFLFYDGDAARDVSHMNRLERGCYFDLIQAQRKFGGFTVEQARKILGKDFDNCWDAIELILICENEQYFIEWVRNSIEKRTQNAEKQRQRIQNYWDKKKYRGNSTVIPKIVIENENENVIENKEEERRQIEFENFRKSYPGTKRGLKVEYENFKKHKDWKEVISLLNLRLDYQRTTRAKKEALKEFIPEWKNLKTWINQRCWEEEIPINIKPQIAKTYEEMLELTKFNPEIWKQYKSIKKDGERKAVFIPIKA